jgi:hypothetical protein
MAALRRSFSKVEHKTIRRKAIVFTGVVVLIILLMQTLYRFMQKPLVYVLQVEMLDQNAYIIDTDTTTFDFFASTLKEAVIIAKRKHKNISIKLILPTDKKKSSAIAVPIQIVALIDLPYQVAFKK